MKSTIPQQSTGDAVGEQTSPQGVGMAVAFDWGLAVQVFVTPFLTTFFGFAPVIQGVDSSSTLFKVLSFVIAWPFAALLAIYGEAVRRGRNFTRRIQVIANTLLSLAGLAAIVNLVRGVKSGNFWPLVTEVILLVFSPLIAWRMSRPSTVRWYMTVSSGEARKRHGGLWPILIALWAIAGGVLQAIAAMK